MHTARAARAVFAGTLIGVGILGFVKGGFVAIWEFLPAGVPAGAILVDACACIALACGIGLLLRQTAALAARVLLLYLLLWLLIFKMPVILGAPWVVVSWESWSESVVIVAGAWVIYGSSTADWDKRYLAAVSAENGVRIARVLYACAMIPFGIAHFAYLDYTASLVPHWLPWHRAWVCLTGSAYLATGIAMLLGVWAGRAAALSAVMMGVFTLLIWAPALAIGVREASVWSETAISWTLTISGWVVAETYRPRSSSA